MSDGLVGPTRTIYPACHLVSPLWFVTHCRDFRTLTVCVIGVQIDLSSEYDPMTIYWERNFGEVLAIMLGKKPVTIILSKCTKDSLLKHLDCHNENCHIISGEKKTT